jgi:hypothetical protein
MIYYKNSGHLQETMRRVDGATLGFQCDSDWVMNHMNDVYGYLDELRRFKVGEEGD